MAAAAETLLQAFPHAATAPAPLTNLVILLPKGKCIEDNRRRRRSEILLKCMAVRSAMLSPKSVSDMQEHNCLCDILNYR